MSTEKQIKKIDLNTLDQADRKVSTVKLKKLGLAVIILLFLSGGGYAAFRIVSGDVVASRFTVNKMTCPACVITVKEVTSKLPGVVEADVSLAAQDVIVKYREKQTNPDQIKEAIAKAGYPIKLDGMFKPDGTGIDEQMIAGVNGKPIFEKDLKVPLLADKTGASTSDPAISFFNTVGKEILLQVADSNTIVVQPYEIEEEIKGIATTKAVTPEQLLNQATEQFGSKEKYFQIVGQRLAIRKLVEDHVVSGVQDQQEKARKTMEWAGSIFKDSDVKILDPKFKEKIHASAGQDDWKTLWPRMISSSTELKSLLVQ
jgi:copper chaperone CopZ